ncbi:MAG: hypothetical protein WA789_00745, partial [Candidatus Acidiferrum sp.]
MPQTASILIEVDDSAAISSFRQMSAEGAKLGPSLAPVGPALDKVTAGTKQAREAAALLSEEVGVNIPRGLRNILASNSAIGPAISAAFTGLAVAGFVTVVKDAVDELTGFSAQLDVIKKQNDALVESVAGANETLKGPQTLKQINAEILQTTSQIEALNQQLGLTGDGLGDALTRGLTKYSAANSMILDQVDRLTASLDKQYQKQAQLTEAQKVTVPLEALKEWNTANEARLE